MSITTNEAWPLLQPYIVIERYGRDTGPNGARHRIEVQTPPSGVVLRQLLAITMPCVACGKPIHPVRMREGHRSHLYLAVACPLEQTFSCARGAKARDEYQRIAAAMTNYTPPSSDQGALPL